MIIRKKFDFEGAHLVRNCSSELCRSSIHGHSYIVEVFLTSNKLDNGQMIYDFGLMKGTIKEFINSFDHAYSFWNKEDSNFITAIEQYSDRWVSMPVSPSAESYSLMFLFVIDKILKNTKFNNGEGRVKVSSVRVHETATGYAESFRSDLKWFKYDLHDIKFSWPISDSWSNSEMWFDLISKKKWTNPAVIQQIGKK